MNTCSYIHLKTSSTGSHSDQKGRMVIPAGGETSLQFEIVLETLLDRIRHQSVCDKVMMMENNK